MLQATLRISGSELTAELLEKIKSLFNGNGNDFEVTISVNKKETPKEAKLRIDRAIENIEQGKGNEPTDLQKLLLAAPDMSDEEFNLIMDKRKALNQWN